MTTNLFHIMHPQRFSTKGPRLIGPSFCRAVLVAIVIRVGAAMAQPGANAARGVSASHKPRIIVTTDLGADPGENNNLVLARPELAKELKALLEATRQSGRSRP
jgi:hypothetical protein